MSLRLGRTIRILRETRGMKLAKLASETGLSNPYLSLVERGERQPSLDSLRKISAKLGVPSEALVLAGMGEQPSLTTTDDATNQIMKSVNQMIDMENRLKELIGSEDEQQAEENHA